MLKRRCFTDEELEMLHIVVLRELTAGQAELRHTFAPIYRRYLQKRVRLAEAVLRKLEVTLPSLGSSLTQ